MLAFIADYYKNTKKKFHGIESFENQIFLVTKTRQLFENIFPQLVAFIRDRLTCKVSPICKNLIDVSQDKKKPEFFNEFSSCMDFEYQKDELRIVATSFLAPEIKNFEKKYSAWENKKIKNQKFTKKAAAASKGNSKNQVNRNQPRRNSNSPSSGHKNTKQDKNQAKSKSSLKDSSSGVNNFKSIFFGI